MKIGRRLKHLESQAATLPRTAAQLIGAYERLSEAERETWWGSLTDVELTTLANSGPGYEGLDFGKLTDDELETIANAPTEYEVAEYVANLRTLKPHYFETRA